MSPSERLARLDALQRSRGFKIGASIVVLAAALAAVVALLVWRGAPEADRPVSGMAEALREMAAAQPEGQSAQAREMLEGMQRGYERMLSDLRAAQGSMAPRMFIVAGSALAGLLVIWVGLGLAFAAMLVLGLGVALPLIVWGGTGWSALGVLMAGALVLGGAFVGMIRGLQIVLSGPSPVLAIARNVVIEAVRKRVSVGLLIALLLVMASIPLLLHDGQELRYRVQMFLQYGTAFSFLIAGVVVVFLGVSSVAAEQRDRIIWQTWTKPVRAWEYVVGKWLGVALVGGVLLGVCGVGVFLFTEYLRRQPAKEEIRAYVVDPDSRDRQAVMEGITPDRLMLEYNVLSAREVVRPRLRERDRREVDEEVSRRYRLEEEQHRLAPFSQPVPDLKKIREDVERERLVRFFTFQLNSEGEYIFEGLQRALRIGRPLSIRAKLATATGITLGKTIRLGIAALPSQNPALEGFAPFVNPAAAGRSMEEVTALLAPGYFIRTVTPNVFTTIPVSAAAVSANGVLRLRFAHLGPENEAFMFAPPDGLEVMYPVGGFGGNFLRTALVLWLKLGFLGAAAILFSSFLSLPVASLASFAVFGFAESAGFLSHALQYWSFLDAFNERIEYWRIPVYGIGYAVSWLFSSYAALSPVEKLSDGINVSWGAAGMGLVTVGVFAGVLVLVSVMILSRREMAMYSGR